MERCDGVSLALILLLALGDGDGTFLGAFSSGTALRTHILKGPVDPADSIPFCGASRVERAARRCRGRTKT